MTPLRRTRRQAAFTIIELLVVMGLVAIVLTLAAPSFRDMIEMQRLRSINAQVVTDIQWARSEAASRQQPTYMTFEIDPSVKSCYTVHTCPAGTACRCFCSQTPLECDSPSSVELRTVSVDVSRGVTVTNTRVPGMLRTPVLAFDPTTGGMTPFRVSALELLPVDNSEIWIDTALIRGGASAPKLRAKLNRAGRPSVCSVNGGISGSAGC